jgi:hypothetical protein
MALLVLSVIPCECEDFFCRRYKIVVDDVSNQIIVGNVYTFSATSDCGNKECIPFNCYTVDRADVSTSPLQPNAVIIDLYNNCEDCILANSNFVILSSCFTDQQFIFPKTSFSPIPNIDDVFYLNFYYSGEFSLVQESGCYRVRSFTTEPPRPETILVSYSGKTDCQNCLETSPIVYSVEPCLGGVGINVALPTSELEKHLITYTDLAGLTQYCGIVKGKTQESPTALFVTDLGVYDEENGIDCDYCLGFVNEKKRLENCLDGTTEVVWASVLFEPGNSTHLNFGNGCYEILPDVVPPSEPISINELANFDPQENCEDCLECYGLIYDFTSCEELTICEPNNILNHNSFTASDFVITDTNIAVVPFFGNNTLSLIDLNTSTIVSTSGSILQNPISCDVDSAKNVICVGNNAYGFFPQNIVRFFNYNNLTQSSTFTFTSILARKVYFNSNDNKFYVTFSNQGFGTTPIQVFSGSSYNTMSNVSSFGTPNCTYNDIIQIGSLIYTLNQTFNYLEIYNTSYVIQSSNFIQQPISFTYDGVNFLYIMTISGLYKFNITTLSSVQIYNSFTCTGGDMKIRINTTTNRLYITDRNCNNIYEFNTLTDTLLKQYASSDLNQYNIFQPWGIANDTSGNTWFGSQNNLFQISCTTDFVSGEITSNEYVPTGTTFFNYELEACCEITARQSITNPSFLNLTEYLSLSHYPNCNTCLNTDLDLFYCNLCGNVGEIILIAPQGLYSVGQFVRSQFGNSDWLCVEIVDVYNPANYGYVDASFSYSGTAFNSCAECETNAFVGLTLINCNTLEPRQVNVTLSDWVEITGFPFGLPNSVVSDSEGICYQVVNSCPIDNNNPRFTVSSYYFNQSFCRTAEQRSGLVSAGTEYTACVICCICDSNGTIRKVSVPHPYWTGIQGNTVILTDAVRLGGTDGLNS